MNINKKEFEFLNNTPETPKVRAFGDILHKIAKIFLWILYVLACIVYTQIKIAFWFLCLFALPFRRKKRKYKRWY